MFLTTVRMEDKAGNAVSLDFTVRPAIYSWLFEKVVKMLFEASTQDYATGYGMVDRTIFYIQSMLKTASRALFKCIFFLKIAQE